MTQLRSSSIVEAAATADRVEGVAAFGFTQRQARFLVTVMLHSGVCLLRQYTAFAGRPPDAPGSGAVVPSSTRI